MTPALMQAPAFPHIILGRLGILIAKHAISCGWYQFRASTDSRVFPLFAQMLAFDAF
jgi:hypothetical protein